jgi:hypothetical protein
MQTVKISCFSEDGASVYEAHDSKTADQFGRTFAFDTLYIGNDDWRYGDKVEINKRIDAFYTKHLGSLARVHG